MTDTPAMLSAPAPAVAPTGPPITAVVVTRGVTPYLRETLTALGAQTRIAARVVIVDAALRHPGELPADDVAQLAARILSPVGTDLRVVDEPGARTFGHAVRGALGQLARSDGAPAAGGAATAPGRTGWLWLLHDDCAPEPAALDELVRAVEHSPSVALAGVKQRSWTDPALLLELGVTTSRLGRRMTGIEEGEVDQGQHDGRDDVLGVGLAGALVRRDVWEALGAPIRGSGRSATASTCPGAHGSRGTGSSSSRPRPCGTPRRPTTVCAATAPIPPPSSRRKPRTTSLRTRPTP
ncbi:glycosyltransferase family 2 protein [Pengzhenrongella phosphoraccumulans]|uniref:glycosyltransferase family 2 protein n=1 Tax=Pengzhenrongella phosphoraccumulans TaxID=3114394 RepID=UPI00388FA300